MNYIDLHAHSTFSLLDGFGTPKQMVERAVELGWGAVSITEHGWMGSAPSLYKAARENGIKPIIGSELYITPDFALGEKGKEFQKLSYHLTVLALSKEGYQNLVAWTSFAMERENFYHKPRISIGMMQEVAPHPLHHNVVLSGCMGSELNQMLLQANGNGHDLARLYIGMMKSVFPNFYIEIQNHHIKKFWKPEYPVYFDMIVTEQAMRQELEKLARDTNTPLVLTNDSHMQRADQRSSHIAMKASAWRHRGDDRDNSKESVSASYLRDYFYFGNYMRDMEKIADDGGIPQAALDSIAGIVEESDLVLDPLDKFTYSIPFSGYDSPLKTIRRRSRPRLLELERKHGRAALDRFEHELSAMGDFAHYLLLLSDFIVEAKAQGILTWTRGSAANSLLCYCLEIHDIDSMEFGLLFSRFYNPARKKLPDVDVDIDPERYEDFMRIVQEKMEPLTGHGQVQQVSNWGTAANRSAFRTAASALGMPKEQQDEISKLLPQMIDSGMVDEDTDVLMAIREDYPELYEIASELFDSIRSVGQHACAWVFGTPERPLADWVPMYLIASSGKLVTQFDFKTVEDFGLVKGDFLRLKMLTVASKVMRMIGKSPLEFMDIPLDDPETLEMIRRGDTDGIHTIQGKEVRRGCVEIGVESVHDVILAAALYRPANTREDRDKLYVERRKGGEIVEFEHPILADVLGPTLGVPVFQEQAMEICYQVGLDDEGVDDVYQAIKKAKGQGRGAKEAFGKVKPKFFAAAKASGIKKAARAALWEFVKAFQGYGFNKGHATSYGTLATKLAYLKRHHPAEYFASLLDVFPDRPTYLAAARAAGFKFLPPSVNRSAAGFTLDRAEDGIRIGLAKVADLGPVAVKEILTGQPFSDYDDFIARTTRRGVNAKRLENLRLVGAFAELGLADRPSDADEFRLMEFTTRKPRAFKGCKPKHVGERESNSGWKHYGREKGLELTPGRGSVSKLFWIPEGVKLELKATPWAQTETWLMTVVDENGIPFEIMVNEDKETEVKLLKFLAQKCQGAVICADGMIRLPFMSGHPQGFRFFGISGAYNGDPQMWHVPEKYKKTVYALNEEKRRMKYAASA